MFSTFAQALRIPELRKKIMFTLMMFLVFRIGSHIPVPGINPEILAQMMSTNGNLFGFVDIISGGAFKSFTIFAMGIMPYINASIIVQLLTMVFPYFERLSKEGPEGRKKMQQIVRYGAVVLGFMQGLAMAIYLKNAMVNPGFFSTVVICVSLTAGTAFLMWLGELITEKGIGNGISLIIFAGIVSRVPSGLVTMYEYVKTGEANVIFVVLFLVFAIACIAGVITIQEGQRKIPVQYAKRVVGRRVYGGQSSHIPMKVNQSGVIPIIFAMTILMFPTTIAGFFPNNGFAQGITKVLSFQHPLYIFLYGLLVVLFTYFYTAVSFNPADVAENLKKQGGFIPGLRPGKPTADYLDRVLSRITMAGAAFLAIIAIMPSIAMSITGWNLYFGGTSLLIAIGVALDTTKQIEAQMLMRHYQGFMK